MPNHVFNQIEVKHSKLTHINNCTKLYAQLTTNDKLDFNKLIPRPDSVYLGNLSSGDEKDFGNHTWYKWNVYNWGTKWNCYSSKIVFKNSTMIIQFQTAWNVPYPYIIAFANTVKLPFTHKYLCEIKEFWGIETWGYDDLTDKGTISRLTKDYNNAKHWQELALLFWDKETVKEFE